MLFDVAGCRRDDTCWRLTTAYAMIGQWRVTAMQADPDRPGAGSAMGRSVYPLGPHETVRTA